jgi:hypothetical protein
VPRRLRRQNSRPIPAVDAMKMRTIGVFLLGGLDGGENGTAAPRPGRESVTMTSALMATPRRATPPCPRKYESTIDLP